MPYRPSPSDPNIERLSDDERREVIQMVQKEISESEILLGEWKNNIVTYYELYAMVQKNKNYNGLANIFVPETIRAVETIVTTLYQLIFSQPDWFQYTARVLTHRAQAVALTGLVTYQMEENGFKARIMDSLRQMVIAGLTVRKVGIDFQEVQRTIPQGPGEKPKRIWDTIKDTWTLEPVDLLTFHISDINIPYNDVQKAVWIAEQYQARKEWSDGKCKKGWFSRIMYDTLLEEEIVSADSSRASQAVDSRLQSSGYSNDKKEGKLEFIERWGLVPAKWVLTAEEMKELEIEDGDEEVEGVIVIANGKAILKLEKNPYFHNQKPYVVCPYIPKEYEIAGIGAVQIGSSLQEELNDTRNQVMDNKTMVLCSMFLKSRASGIKDKDLIFRPYGVVNTNDMNGLRDLRPPIVTGVGTNLEGVIKNDLRESVGASSNLQGIAQAGVDSASEATIINKQSLGRLVNTAQLFAELVLKPVLIFAEYYNYQFYDHEKTIRVIGEGGVKYRQLTPTEISGGHKDVTIRISLDATENPAIIRQQFQTFVQGLFGMSPELIQFHYKSLDKLYGMFFSGHKLDELYPNPNPSREDLLTPEDERDMVLADQPVLAQQGQDHRGAIDYLVKELQSMQLALSPLQFELFKKLIQSHYELLQAEVEQAQQEFVAQQMMMEANQGKQGGGKAGVNKGTTKNLNPANAAGKAPSTESMAKELGG